MTRSTIIDEYIGSIEELFRKNGNRERAAGAKVYMRDLFNYFGISTPDRRQLEREFHNEHALPSFSETEQIVRKLWTKSERELQYFAMELCYKHRKAFPRKALHLFEYMIRNKSWWDTVDFIAIKLVNSYFQLYPDMILPKTKEWINSGHIWLMRTALIFQNNDKKKTDEKLLFKLILICSGHPDFFIRKAIGWSLRQYARTNPASVKKFVTASELSELSRKEALKHIGE